MQSTIKINPDDLGPNARDWLAKATRVTGLPASIIITSTLLDYRARAEQSAEPTTPKNNDSTAPRNSR